MLLIKITKENINREEVRRAVAHPDCGAIATFEGDIRNHNDGKEVLGLEYEVYEKMFQAEVKKIFHELAQRWEVKACALVQRVGRLDVGEAGIVIAVSSPHRHSGMAACAWAIEEFKKRAPVWKKEYYLTDAQWVLCNHGGK